MIDEVPNFVYIGGIMGLVLLGISLVLFVIYFTLYNEAQDTSVTLTKYNYSSTEIAFLASYITTGLLGFFLCLLIPYGHYIKSHHDPSVIHSKNGLHIETFNPETFMHEATHVKNLTSYQTAGSRDPSLKFSGGGKERFL